ncbi:unnamed protein product, partial [Owenia fusiformis]
SLDIMNVHTCSILLYWAVVIVKGDYCDCKLSVGRQQSSHNYLPERLDSQEKLLDSLEKRHQRLQDENALKLQRLGSSKSTAEGLTETVYYKLSDTCPEGFLRCLESSECIHGLQGCDGVIDCLDGSDEDPYICINPWKLGFKSQCIVPTGQTFFPDGSAVHLLVDVTKVIEAEWLPQAVKLEGSIQYVFNETDGIQKSGALKLSSTYFTASGIFYTMGIDDEYDIKLVGKTAYFLGSFRSYVSIYDGVKYENLCGGCYFNSVNAKT